MMKDIPITTNNDYSSYNDEYLFEFILDHYNSYNQTNIRRLWKYEYFLDFEDEEVEDDIDEINNMNLSLIKKYAPDIYNTYEYDTNDNCFTAMYEQNLEVCADIIHRRFNNRFF